MKTTEDILAADYFGLKDTVCMVTGASSGLGWHFSQVLASAGCKVGLAARREDRLKELHKKITQMGGQSMVLPMDVTDRSAVEKGIEQLSSEYGPVQLLINNAGVADSKNFVDSHDSDTSRIFSVNQTAVWQVAQAVTRHMIKASVSGSIINIASIAGIRTIGGAASYSVSKAAVTHLTKIMAMELARHNIRVNALAPGYIATEMNAEFLASDAGNKLINRVPMRRSGESSELDAPLLLLASNKGSFITGAVLPVDGGHVVASL